MAFNRKMKMSDLTLINIKLLSNFSIIVIGRILVVMVL